MAFDDAPAHNQLLAALGPSALDAIKPHLTTVFIEPPNMLFGADGSIDNVYFPENAVVSLVNAVGEGPMVEVVAVGSEGMAGLSVFLNGYRSTAFAQQPGFARRMNARVFSRLSAAPGPLHQVMLRYTQAVLAQTAQKATCVAAHLLEQRCASWLLTTRERVDADEFMLVPDFLSLLLGVRHAGVTLAMRSLQDRRLIRCTSDRIDIIDAAGLERASCGCHVTTRVEYARLLPEVA